MTATSSTRRSLRRRNRIGSGLGSAPISIRRYRRLLELSGSMFQLSHKPANFLRYLDGFLGTENQQTQG